MVGDYSESFEDKERDWWMSVGMMERGRPPPSGRGLK